MKTLLIVAYWIGILADAGATVLLFFPSTANLVLAPKPFELTPMFMYVSRVGGALMLGWTVLLFWAQLKPLERADILLITLFPVVALLALAAVLVTGSGAISLTNMVPMFVLYIVIFGTYIPSYLWARKQRSAAN